MEIFHEDDWKSLSDNVRNMGDELSRRFPGITLSDIEFQVWIPSGNIGRIGSVLTYLDVSFRWAISIANEISAAGGNSSDLMERHPLPISAYGGGLRLQDVGLNSPFWAKMKAANDAATRCLAVPHYLLAIFVSLTGVHQLASHENTPPPPPPSCERVLAQLPGTDALLKSFRDAGPGGYSLRITCRDKNGTDMSIDWGMERKATSNDLAQVRDVQLLRYKAPRQEARESPTQRDEGF
ncbi:hypothetical protein OHN37_16305 [Streptomyces sp. NBC_00485]|uniref:hypothetical protein n=1 Tax=Streptomyces sp. NBC_00485 TaxID=2975758 RepID=UPI002E16C4E4